MHLSHCQCEGHVGTGFSLPSCWGTVSLVSAAVIYTPGKLTCQRSSDSSVFACHLPIKILQIQCQSIPFKTCLFILWVFHTLHFGHSHPSSFPTPPRYTPLPHTHNFILLLFLFIYLYLITQLINSNLWCPYTWVWVWGHLLECGCSTRSHILKEKLTFLPQEPPSVNSYSGGVGPYELPPTPF